MTPPIKNDHTISPVYVLSIFLSVPAGIGLALLMELGPTWHFMAVAIVPSVVVCLVAFFHTRHLNRVS